MNRTIYLVDNNALVAIKRKRVQSPFFRAHCRVTSDVLYEAAEHPDFAQLSQTACALSPAVIAEIAGLMRAVPVGDTSLVDLYGNKGAADPGIVAFALSEMARDADSLFPDAWVVVTNDLAVRALAVANGVQALAPQALAAIIDNAQG